MLCLSPHAEQHYYEMPAMTHAAPAPFLPPSPPKKRSAY
jgi:hypothetical protein